ncbi:MAG: type II secretion system minor pseudopilin GspJ [Gammaproteobacteria bacterium]
MNGQRGFTLIEVLVAVAIFGMLSVAAYTVLDSGMRSQKQSEERLSHLAELQRLFFNISQDFAYISKRPSRNDLGDLEPLLYGESDVSGQGFKMAFNRTNWRNPAGFPRSHMQHVEYRLEDEKIYRKHRVFLDMAPNTPEVDRMLAADIESVIVQFQSPTKQWSDGWGQFVEMQDKMPVAVRIQITSKLFGELERYFFIPYSVSDITRVTP